MQKRTFEQWMKAVDSAVQTRCGLSVHDLPDCCFREWYEEDVTPTHAAGRAIKAARE